MKFISSLFTLSLCFAIYAAQAQNVSVLFYGNITDNSLSEVLNIKEKPSKETFLDSVWVEVYANDSLVKSFYNRHTGFYNVTLETENLYNVVFSKPGYITKRFAIDTRNVHVAPEIASLKMLTDVSLFRAPEQPGNLTSYSKRPVAKCSFNEERNRLEWDMAFAREAFDQFLRLARETSQSTASSD